MEEKEKELIEEEVSSEDIYHGKVFDIKRDVVRLPDGNTSVREYAVHKGAVCVIPLTEKDEVICVRQYRYAIRKVFLEIPAGKFDFVGEEPETAARRELREETGAVAGKFRDLGSLITSPAILTERIYMYLAEDLSFGETDFDEDEFIETVKIPLREMVDMVMRGEIEDSKTQIAVLKAWQIKNGGK